MTTPTPEAHSRKGFLSLPFLRDLLLIALVVVIAWKTLNADFKVDLASFSFNDFLALVLALFSVALSVAFYFKANERAISSTTTRTSSPKRCLKFWGASKLASVSDCAIWMKGTPECESGSTRCPTTVPQHPT